jgi:hypothetical protein
MSGNDYPDLRSWGEDVYPDDPGPANHVLYVGPSTDDDLILDVPESDRYDDCTSNISDTIIPTIRGEVGQTGPQILDVAELAPTFNLKIRRISSPDRDRMSSHAYIRFIHDQIMSAAADIHEEVDPALRSKMLGKLRAALINSGLGRWKKAHGGQVRVSFPGFKNTLAV